MKALVFFLALLVLSAQAAPKGGQKNKGRTERHDALVECGMYYMYTAEQAKKRQDEHAYQVNTRLLRIAMAHAVSLNLPIERLKARKEAFVTGVKEASKIKSSEEVQSELTEKHEKSCFELMERVS